MDVTLLDDPDYPGIRPAFWAAYEELGLAGVAHADIRGDLAFRVVKTLTDKRATGGMRSMLRISQSTPDDRRPLVLAVLDNQPSSWTWPTQGAIDAAIVVAARELAKG